MLAKGEAGKEILYPVALVVLGGLTTSTLLDIALRPTIFFNYTRNEATRIADAIRKRKQPSNVFELAPTGGSEATVVDQRAEGSSPEANALPSEPPLPPKKKEED